VNWVKCVTVLIERSASSDPSNEASVYMIAPSETKRSGSDALNAQRLRATTTC
jgi:hypothetical protein